MNTNLKHSCYLCGKGILYGKNVSHAKNRTRRVIKPNLKKMQIVSSNKTFRAWVCASCIAFSNRHRAVQNQPAVIPVKS